MEITNYEKLSIQVMTNLMNYQEKHLLKYNCNNSNDKLMLPRLVMFEIGRKNKPMCSFHPE